MRKLWSAQSRLTEKGMSLGSVRSSVVPGLAAVEVYSSLLSPTELRHKVGAGTWGWRSLLVSANLRGVTVSCRM